MFQKKLFLVSIFFVHSCFSMDDGTKRRLLGSDARPIHNFLTINVDDKNINIDEKSLSDFITSFKNLDVAPSILCDLPDCRNWFGPYRYKCPTGQQFEIEYSHPNTGNNRQIINGGNEGTILGIPIAVSVTKNAKKCKIDLIDENHSWVPALYEDRRTYNLIRLLFDCDRSNEAQRILSSTDKMLGINIHSKVLTSFEAMYKRYSEDNENNENIRSVLDKLKSRFVCDHDPADCNCCATTCQCFLLCGMVFAKGIFEGPSARSLRLIAAMGIGVVEWGKQYDWKSRKHSTLSKVKKN